MKTTIKYFFFLIGCFISISAYAQPNMQQGFDLLETGVFDKAELFFDVILQDYPENKTAQICYGRAVGLNGRPEKAMTMFKGMLTEYPNDIEVKLNYYESLLWAKKFEEAKPFYKLLAADNPDIFGALLGYANTLSNLKEYEDALLWINKAIDLQPDNPNAKVSRKYIKLGYASEYVKAKKYTEAEDMLFSIFEDFPGDKDVNLNLANLYLVTKDTEKGIKVYQDLAVSYDDSIKSLAGISLVYHIATKEKRALEYATMAKQKALGTDSAEMKQVAAERYTQALIWNREYKLAELSLDSLNTIHRNEKWLLALNATLGMYRSDFDESIDYYNQLLKIDSASFDGNLGKANALYASGRFVPAYSAAFKTLQIYDQQKDATEFVEKLNAQFSPNVEEQLAFTFDNGNNSAIWSNTVFNTPITEKLTTQLSYRYRETQNTVTKYRAVSNTLGAGASYAILPGITLKALFGLNISQTDSLKYTQPVLDFILALKPYKLQDLTLGYKREIQNFNAELIARDIVMHHVGLTYNMGTNINLGWYTQMIYTRQTDNNERKLLFTSLYYNLLQKPLLKTGINYQYLGFKDQVPTIYFSPEQYHALEWFVDSRGKIFENTEYVTNFALGYQKVEKDPLTTLFRAEVGLTQHFTKRLSAKVYGLYSNVASATASGFEYVEFGFKIKWQLTKTPLFYNKLK